MSWRISPGRSRRTPSAGSLYRSGTSRGWLKCRNRAFVRAFRASRRRAHPVRRSWTDAVDRLRALRPSGTYKVARLRERHGDAKLTDLLQTLTNCHKGSANMTGATRCSGQVPCEGVGAHQRRVRAPLTSSPWPSSHSEYEHRRPVIGARGQSLCALGHGERAVSCCKIITSC
jgi:hypothetical protein